MTQIVTSKALSPRQKRAVLALLELPTIEQAAGSVGVTRRTLYRWLDDPGFTMALRSAEGALLDKNARRLLSLSEKAIDALESVLDDPIQDGASTRRLAAGQVLDVLMRFRELRSFEERVTELEAIFYDRLNQFS